MITQPCHAGGRNLMDGSCVCALLCCNYDNGGCTCPDCNGVSCNCTPESRKREEVAEEGDRSCDLQVGDRVKGSGGGLLGTVTHVAYNGIGQQQVWARKDSSSVRGGWTQPLPRDRFILAERASATPMKFKVGDRVRFSRGGNTLRPGKREVTYVSYDWVLYAYQDGEECVRRNAFERDYELVPDFFEAGKTYRCHGSTFEVEHIQRDGDGQLVAIGRKTNKYADKSGTTYWHTQRSFSDNGWEEV